MIIIVFSLDIEKPQYTNLGTIMYIHYYIKKCVIDYFNQIISVYDFQ